MQKDENMFPQCKKIEKYYFKAKNKNMQFLCETSWCLSAACSSIISEKDSCYIFK